MKNEQKKWKVTSWKEFVYTDEGKKRKEMKVNLGVDWEGGRISTSSIITSRLVVNLSHGHSSEQISDPTSRDRVCTNILVLLSRTTYWSNLSNWKRTKIKEEKKQKKKRWVDFRLTFPPSSNGYTVWAPYCCGLRSSFFLFIVGRCRN